MTKINFYILDYRFEDGGLIERTSIGCGCCSEGEYITKKELDEDIEELKKKVEELTKLSASLEK